RSAKCAMGAPGAGDHGNACVRRMAQAAPARRARRHGCCSTHVQRWPPSGLAQVRLAAGSWTMIFQDRVDAGVRLAGALERYRSARPLVLGLPRGGVPVAYAIAST